jgi:hypothetical protein
MVDLEPVRVGGRLSGSVKVPRELGMRVCRHPFVPVVIDGGQQEGQQKRAQKERPSSPAQSEEPQPPVRV